MKILVISDTHGRVDAAVEIYKTLKNIDLIIHLGDLFSDAQKIEKQLGVRVLSVKGNMDGSFARDGHKILKTDFGDILLAHGHMENVKQSPQNIMYKAESLGCKAVFYGHTHVPVFTEINELYLLNPGSLTLPVGGRKASYAIATITATSLEAVIVYQDIKSRLKSEPGVLSNLLNNSDRF